MRPRRLRLLILAAQYFPAVGSSESKTRLLAREFKVLAQRYEELFWGLAREAGEAPGT